MLRTQFSLEVLQNEIRRQVCAHCRWRPHHSETLGADVARSCEPACSLFRNLPALARTALLMDPMLRPIEQTLRRHVRELRAAPTASKRGTHVRPPGRCPLTRYQDEVIRTIVWYVHA